MIDEDELSFRHVRDLARWLLEHGDGCEIEFDLAPDYMAVHGPGPSWDALLTVVEGETIVAHCYLSTVVGAVDTLAARFWGAVLIRKLRDPAGLHEILSGREAQLLLFPAEGSGGLGTPIAFLPVARRSRKERPILVRPIGKVVHVWFHPDGAPATQMFEVECDSEAHATDRANALRDPMLLDLTAEGAWAP